MHMLQLSIQYSQQAVGYQQQVGADGLTTTTTHFTSSAEQPEQSAFIAELMLEATAAASAAVTRGAAVPDGQHVTSTDRQVVADHSAVSTSQLNIRPPTWAAGLVTPFLAACSTPAAYSCSASSSQAMHANTDKWQQLTMRRMRPGRYQRPCVQQLDTPAANKRPAAPLPNNLVPRDSPEELARLCQQVASLLLQTVQVLVAADAR